MGRVCLRRRLPVGVLAARGVRARGRRRRREPAALRRRRQPHRPAAHRRRVRGLPDRRGRPDRAAAARAARKAVAGGVEGALAAGPRLRRRCAGSPRAVDRARPDVDGARAVRVVRVPRRRLGAPALDPRRAANGRGHRDRRRLARVRGDRADAVRDRKGIRRVDADRRRHAVRALRQQESFRRLDADGAAAHLRPAVRDAVARDARRAALLARSADVALDARRQPDSAHRRRDDRDGDLARADALAVGWAGSDVIASRFGENDWHELDARRGAWTDALDVSARFPLTGTGLNTYGVATILYQRHDLEHHYEQAHNDYLQLMAEGGVLLAVPAALCLAVFALTVRRRFRDETSTTAYWLRVGAVTGLAAIALQETFDFSLQMPGNALLFAVLCGIALHVAPPKAEVPRRPQV
ncbi:MAG: hypothetical protein DMF93_19480 [Acidobacteria bacterium]|nr:MAG: hypothetical protein DMF93_19480 [Acidobacteriota bacterium]